MSNLPKDYIVYAFTIEEAKEITAEQKRLFNNSNPAEINTYYRIEPNNTIGRRFGFASTKGWYETNNPSLPIYTFKEWKQMKEGSKYTIEYCKANKVAVRIHNEEQWNIFNEQIGSTSTYFNPNYYTTNDGTYWSSSFNNTNGIGDYEIIEFEQLNLKIQENMEKKIIGYKCPVTMFNGGVQAGTIYKPLASLNNISYAATNSVGNIIDRGKTNLPKEIVETWEKYYEPEFKEGDWVLLKGDNTGNGICDKEVIIKLLKINEDKNPTGNLKWYSHFMVFFKGDYYRTNKAHIIREATEEEIKEATNVEINGYKCVKTEEGVEFGCQKFSRAELATISRLIFSPIDAQITIGGREITKELLNKIMY